MVWVCEPRQVCTPPDLDRISQVGNIEDAKAPESVVTDLAGHAHQAAIDSGAHVLHGHDQQVAGDRHVTLAARADNGAHQLRHCFADVVDVEAVIVAGHQYVIGEGHVSVGEAQQRWAGLAVVLAAALLRLAFLAVYRGFVTGFFPCAVIVFLSVIILVVAGNRLAGGVLGVEKTVRLGQGGDEFQVGDRLAGIAKTGGQADARIRREAGQHGRHALDLGFLIVDDVGREFIKHRVLGRAV